METPSLDTAPVPAKIPSTEKSSGKGSRNRRRDARRSQINSNKAPQLEESTRNALGLSETTALATLKPAYSTRPTGVYISLAGANEAIKAMFVQARCIAQRPLANLLTDANVTLYRKVVTYLLTVRVSCAQTSQAFVAGADLRQPQRFAFEG